MDSSTLRAPVNPGRPIDVYSENGHDQPAAPLTRYSEPYRFAEIEAEDPRRWVFLARDREEVDAIFAQDSLATCPSPDRPGWIDSDFAEPLRGRRVAIIGRDDEFGYQESARLAAALWDSVQEVRIIEPAGLKPRQSVCLWLKAGFKVVHLHAFVETAEPWKPETPGSGAKRPAIEVNTERHRVRDETLAVLPSDPDLFCRGNVLVRIAREMTDVARLSGGVELRRAAGGARVVMMGEAGLSCRLTALADFFSWRADKSGEDQAAPVHPPGWLTRALLEEGVYPGVRPLKGIAEVPFPRPDGSLVTAAGYDPGTGVFYAPTVAVEPVPGRPSKDEALDAAKVLFELVEQFPFASVDDFAVWLAGLLTVLARPAIAGPGPGFALVGNRAGTGKGKLIDTIGVIATGRPIPCTSYPESKEEATKVKTALALAATPIVHLDNLDEGRTYGSGALDSALTSLEVNERILGQSKTTDRLELRCCWFLSGNNITPAKDAFRRWLVCNLITELERPEERDDLKIPDLLAHVRARRGELVRAALVILRAHAVAGHPTGGWAPLGSFEGWDRVVRGAVWFATGRDCNATRRQAAEEAPDRLDRLALLEAWAELPQGGPRGDGVTAEEAHRLASTEPDRYPSLVNALMRISKDGRTPAPRSIGNRIRAMRGQNIGGRAFQAWGERHRSILWRVVKL